MDVRNLTAVELNASRLTWDCLAVIENEHSLHNSLVFNNINNQNNSNEASLEELSEFVFLGIIKRIILNIFLVRCNLILRISSFICLSLLPYQEHQYVPQTEQKSFIMHKLQISCVNSNFHSINCIVILLL